MKKILFISENSKGEFYAEVKSSNTIVLVKTIWITSESYLLYQSLLKTLKYIQKPDVIKYKLPTKSLLVRTNIEKAVESLWE